MNPKVLLDAYNTAEARVQEIAAQINGHLDAEENDQALALKPQLDEAKTAAEKAHNVYLLALGTAEEQRSFKPAAPAVLKTGLGDSEIKAFAHYFRNGDDGGIRQLRGHDEEGKVEYSIKLPSQFLKNATDEVFTSGATEAGPAIPTGFSGQIAARKQELMLADRLGIRRVPGVGLTVNFPFDNADAVVFATTSEQVDAHTNTYERDRPTLGTKAFTLVKKTKKIELPEEVLLDEDANLMGFIADYIGRGMALTHNSALITEVAANGTSLKTFASATAIAAGEPEDLVFHDTLGNYLDDGNAISWVMKPTTFGKVKKITGNARMYEERQGAGSQGRTLLEYPVNYSSYPGSVAASGKSLYFGNWYYVGLREDPTLSFIRDPYTYDGLVLLKYMFRLVYGVLIAGAVGYGVHPSA